MATNVVTLKSDDDTAPIDITVPQGATFRGEFSWRRDGSPQSLAGYRAIMSVARRPGGVTIFTVSSDAGEIVLEPDNQTGVIVVVMSPAKTMLLTRPSRYDLLLLAPDGSDAVRVARGAVLVDLGVTRIDDISTGAGFGAGGFGE